MMIGQPCPATLKSLIPESHPDKRVVESEVLAALFGRPGGPWRIAITPRGLFAPEVSSHALKWSLEIAGQGMVVVGGLDLSLAVPIAGQVRLLLGS